MFRVQSSGPRKTGIGGGSLSCLGCCGLKQGLSPGPDEEETPPKVSAGPVALDGGGRGGRAVTYPEPACPPPQENPCLWNKFADGKLLFQNSRLLSAVCGNKDPMVQEFWRLLAICHTVMVQEKGREWVVGRPACEGAQTRRLLQGLLVLEVMQPTPQGSCPPACVPSSTSSGPSRCPSLGLEICY